MKTWFQANHKKQHLKQTYLIKKNPYVEQGEKVISTYLLHVTLIKEREEKAHKHWILTLFLYKFADPAQWDKVIYYFYINPITSLEQKTPQSVLVPYHRPLSAHPGR